ncbi:hypothetical protein KFE25_005525 [Diacronema lutheri]|uniref:F-box domain-containing protein n=1 Tax=Diacronema lutheri TaxID=2081491 RepID=A0A8J5XV30_DIALT|nr:hypothetical protein KFE25_005525 [Diacronema lutheri]
MLDLLHNDVLGVLLQHLAAEDFERLAAVCTSLRRKVMAAETLWAAHLGGRATYDDVARRALALAPSASARAPLARALAVRKAALANWRSAQPATREWVLEPRKERAGMVTALELDDLTLAAGGSDHCVRVWELRSRRQVATLRGHTGAVRCLLLRGCADGALFSGAWDKTIRRWDVRSGACEQLLAGGHERCVMALALVSEHLLVSAGGEGRVVWWDLRTGARVRTRRHASPILALELNGRATVAAFADGSVRAWRTQLAPAEAARGCGDDLELASARWAAPTADASSSADDADDADDALDGGAPSGAPATGSRADGAAAAGGGEWYVSPCEVLAPPSLPCTQPAARASHQRLPNGQPLPAELVALYDEFADPSKFVSAHIRAARRASGGGALALALCSHRELVLASLCFSDRAPHPPGGRTAGDGDPAVHGTPSGVHTEASFNCAGAASCCALLPEAAVALVGCRSTNPPGAAPTQPAGACVLIHDASAAVRAARAAGANAGAHRRRPARPARLLLATGPSAILVRWDVLVVGTQGGCVHVFDFTCAAAQPARAGWRAAVARGALGGWRALVGAERALWLGACGALAIAVVAVALAALCGLAPARAS